MKSKRQGQSEPESSLPAVRRGWKAGSTRLVLLSTGTIALGLGTAGVFLPGLPTTPFVLIAAACYARSSHRMYRWLIDHPGFGPPLQQLLAGRGLPMRVKAQSLGLAYLFLGMAAAFWFTQPWARFFLLVVALVKTYYLLWRLPTAGRNRRTATSGGTPEGSGNGPG